MTVNVDMVSTYDMTSESWLTRAYTWYTVPVVGDLANVCVVREESFVPYRPMKMSWAVRAEVCTDRPRAKQS